MSEQVQNQQADAAADFASAADQTKSDAARPEISGTAIARMMGVATSTELKLIEGKLDLISGRLNNISVKVDKIISQFNSLPTGSDLERIDVQIGSLKTLIRDLMVTVSGEPVKSEKKHSKPVQPEETEILETTEAAE